MVVIKPWMRTKKVIFPMQNTQLNIAPKFSQAVEHVPASAVLMVPPRTFMFNPQTGQDNEFQHATCDSDKLLQGKALGEFDNMVNNLRRHGVEVILLDNYQHGEVLPDAVFPNNWFATNRQGEMLFFPMLTENRRQEVKPEAVRQILIKSERKISHSVFVGAEQPHLVLEGTGAMVLDHQNNRVFAALSDRCDSKLLADFAEKQGFDSVICFSTEGATGKPIYHTNVMLSIGQDIAVICSETIVNPEERARVLRELEATHEVIDIDYQQMAEHFCANVLQLISKEAKRLWVMSESAYNGFTIEQKRQLESSGTLVVNPIPTIENVGGGSCRCMLAEIFLPLEA